MSTDPIPQGSPAVDPSMDDILASIRRILDEEGQKQEPEAAAGDADAPHPAPPGLPPRLPDDDDDDVLELDQFMVAADPPPTNAGPVPAPPPILAEPSPVTDALPTPDQVHITPPPVLEAPPPAPMPALLAPDTVAATAVSVGALLRTLASERSTAVHRGGPTIEDLVREEMRPLLKDWLDSHLPPLVERLVRAEIERVVSRMT